MKRLLMLPIYFLALHMQAQTIAENWTQTDCAGQSHDLFETLDTGTVVVMEIVMLDGCMPCINAAHLMEPVIEQYNATYANRVHWYTMGYDDSYPCADLIAWKTENAISCTAQFVEGADIASYYGGMGMPTVVVVGRSSHMVYFNQFGFVPADTVEFSDAIAYALGIAEPEVSIHQSATIDVQVFPNPATDALYVTGDWLPDATIIISDLTGSKKIVTRFDTESISLQALPAGTYVFTITDGGKTGRKVFLHQ